MFIVYFIDVIATQLKKLSYNFQEWFGALPQPNQYGYYKHPTRVGPFLIYHSINIETDLRIRVDLLTNTGHQDNFIEIICHIENISEQNINIHNNLQTTVSIRGLHVRNIYYELYRSSEVFIETIFDMTYRGGVYTNSKSLNHLNRALYAIKLLDYLYTETPNDPFIKNMTHKEDIFDKIDIEAFKSFTSSLDSEKDVENVLKNIKSPELKKLLKLKQTQGGMRYKRTTRKRQRKRANRKRLNKTR